LRSSVISEKVVLENFRNTQKQVGVYRLFGKNAVALLTLTAQLPCQKRYALSVLLQVATDKFAYVDICCRLHKKRKPFRVLLI